MNQDFREGRQALAESVLARQRRRQIQIKLAIATIALAGGVLLLFVGVVLVLKIRTATDPSDAFRELLLAERSRQQSETQKFQSVQSALAALEAKTAAIQTPKAESQLSVEVADLKTQIESVRAEVTALRASVGAAPEKAVELPLIRRDLEHQKELNAAVLSALRESMDRSFNMLMGVLAVFATILTTGAGLAWQAFRRTDPKASQAD